MRDNVSSIRAFCDLLREQKLLERITELECSQRENKGSRRAWIFLFTAAPTIAAAVATVVTLFIK